MLDQYFSGLGVDLSDHHVRIAQISSFGSVQRLEEISLPEGLVVDEKVIQPDTLKPFLDKHLQRLPLGKHSLRTTILIPDSRIFAHTVSVDGNLRGEELRLRSRAAAQKDIPVPFSEARVSVSEASKEAHNWRATVYAVEQAVLDPLVQAFQLPSIRLVALEANSKALLRFLDRFGNIKPHPKDMNTLIGLVDIGHSWSTISVYPKQGSLLFSRTLPHRLAQDIDRQNPLLPDRIVDMILGTMQEVMVFFHERQMDIGQVIFAGVEAHDDRLKAKIGAQKNMPPSSLIGEIVKLKGINNKQIHKFGAALGAALRSVAIRSNFSQHNFLTH